MDEFSKEIKINDLKNGYFYNESKNVFTCILCNSEYEKGHIYSSNEVLIDAEKAIKNHIIEKHGSAFMLLLENIKNGLSDIQKSILESIYKNQSDSEIAIKQGNKAKSTIRNHRFILREKYKEAKVFIAIMELLDNKMKKSDRFIDFHKNIPVNDERIMITEEEKDKIIEKYFDNKKPEMILKRIPKKQKEKLVILKQIITVFDKNKRYSEKEINQILKNIADDFASIRRYLVDFNFMNRTKSGSEYWITID